MRRVAAFLLLAGLSQIPLWAGDYFMPARSLYPTYQETVPPAAPVVVSEVRVQPLAPAPALALTPAKVTKTAAKKTTPKSEPVVVKAAPATATVAETAVVVPTSGTAPVVNPVYGKTVGVELLPPTGVGRAVSVTPPSNPPFVAVTPEKPALGSAAKAAKKAVVVKTPTETVVPVAVTLPGTTITRTEYVATKTTFAAPATVVPIQATAAPEVPVARVLAPTRPVVPVQYIAPTPTPVPPAPMAAPAAAPVYTGGECPTCGRSGSCDSGGLFSGRFRSWLLFQPTTRDALPRFQPLPYIGPVLAWRCDGNCPPGSYWGGCNMPGHCGVPGGAGCGGATGGCATGACGGARAAVAGAANGLGGRTGFGLGLGGACKSGCTPPADDAIAGYRFANGTQQVGGSVPVEGPVTSTSYKPAAAPARTLDAPSKFYKPSYGTDAAPAANAAPAGGNVLARPFTRP